MNELYEGYFEARDWGATKSQDHFWYYDEVAKLVRIPPHSQILEIGFGDARFLDWGKSRGMRMTGIEILQLALQKAKGLEHEVYLGPLTSTTLPSERMFDIVVAFDVVEHLTIEEMKELLVTAMVHLRPNGRLLFRFPNGDSPFVGPTQTADVTHKTIVSPGLVRHLCGPIGLDVETVFNDRFLPSNRLKRLKRRFTYLLRSMIQLVIGYAYFGSSIPLDPNVFVTLRKA